MDANDGYPRCWCGGAMEKVGSGDSIAFDCGRCEQHWAPGVSEAKYCEHWEALSIDDANLSPVQRAYEAGKYDQAPEIAMLRKANRSLQRDLREAYSCDYDHEPTLWQRFQRFIHIGASNG